MIRSGLILINKPEGPTSFDIIRDLKKRLMIRKMGHAGTLDPLASGLLIVAVGECTKILSHIPTEPKIYDFTVQFGETRTTADREGDISESGLPLPKESDLLAVIPRFVGEILQRPPAYSAVKIDGKRAYELARKGIDPDIKPRKTTVHSLILHSYNEETGTASLTAKVSTGTYIRSLATDLGIACNSGAYAARIHRTDIGFFSLADAKPVDEIKGVENLLNPTEVTEWDSIKISPKEEALISNGNSIKTDKADTPYCWLVDQTGVPKAISSLDSGRAKPIRVFPNW